MTRSVALIALALACLVGAVPLSDASFSATSQSFGSVGSSIDWTPPSVTMDDPGEYLRDTVTLSASATDAETTIAGVTIQIADAGSGQWVDVCHDDTSPYTCDLATAPLAEGHHDLRAVATDAEDNVGASAVVADRIVDRTPPTVTLEPLPALSGTVTLTATATDGLSGVGTVAVQVMVGGDWTTACTSADTTTPYTCSWDTTTVANGSHSFRAVATDRAGNSATSTTRTGTVDNQAASIVLQDPGAHLRGNVTLTADASSPFGVASVRIQHAPTGTSVWTDVCTDTSAPYSCAWATTAVDDGVYDLRAIMVDSQATSTTSAVVAQRRVDNISPHGVDVQANTGGNGRIDAGDTLVLTWSEPMQLDSILTTGWTEPPQNVAIRLRDGRLVGDDAEDTIDVFTTKEATTPVHLGTIDLDSSFVQNNQQLVFAATMTVTVGPGGGTVVTLTIGELVAGTPAHRQTTPSNSTANMVWTPSSASSDLAGNPASTEPRTETGAQDRDF